MVVQAPLHMICAIWPSFGRYLTNRRVLVPKSLLQPHPFEPPRHLLQLCRRLDAIDDNYSLQVVQYVRRHHRR